MNKRTGYRWLGVAGAALAAACIATGAFADGEFGKESGDLLARRQARSVHLFYGAARPVVSAMATITVTETRPQTYFAILNWHQGYCGIQDWGDQKVFIFSVWDPSDPEDFAARHEDVKEEHRARVLYQNPCADVSRFGGEGTGAKTICGMAWEAGKPVTVKVETAPDDGGKRIAFTCSVRTGEQSPWEKVATISTLRDESVPPGLVYIASFVEDFRRNFKSAKESRGAEFGNIFVKQTQDGEWQQVMKARFSADGNPAENIDAGSVRPGVFFLKTGGDTRNEHAKLWTWIE